MDLSKAFATNEAAERDGVDVEFGGAKFRVARAGNAAYRKLLSKLYKQNRTMLESKGDAAEKKSDAVLSEVLSKTILLGWSGVEADGKPLPFSQEKAYELLLGLKEFRKFITDASEDLERYKLHQDEEDLGK
jgi:hypothetical protein